ncbi:MAG: trigger factor [Candidatus Yanofskybacteria bacterium RIFCSPLOWO2_02_FULL_43_10]|uniref:Trigger factor n=1 Tax=Candidatus Yanofskybacteria bacterium RIFCSPLOWO2_12_FULL_43_11b TaxID=1802710 RepID=A0A1F8H8Y4_9BACT|nr:MAG: trigger factor [Candidatus Yanofskybacteria bacterium RIFCSPHIGHO2_01_FULL_43_32]OGN10818.1 MAG: trigger factor [Candidatus Yanofskybacteria bacterium RIFCSPHIGHO2_02_FULL_43_12]OGN18019.1 MAG: trigger factor [Candidatus Yanofskybacteria bacterium RIFCSPHIGHO2_12_FULL_43_11]OGN25040.1 MAG: trigger factor [Candidatus Yanofskybacteria bacterium RIFCSPLOWO2_01_FULL_43_46]OGN30338.1 MAG: trigger factor [Candidatus Yanofskybacteria bacterium RIFCSPLOWO2_02_FULL_43_10]OGN34053.1 MAG: trigger
MNHTLKKIDQDQAELVVELAKDDLKAYIDRTESELGRDLQLDGFRKGKAPKDLLKNNLDAKQVLESALDLAMKDSLAKTIEKEKLDVLNVSGLEIKENTPDKLVYRVVLTLFPEIKIRDFSEFKVVRRDIKVDQKDIDNTLETIKTSRSILRDKEGTVQNGDRVEVDFEVRHNGQMLEGGISKNHPLIIGGKNFMPGFEDNLLEMNKDEEKTFSLVAPNDYYVKKIAGQKLDFTVRVNNIKSVELPKIDDEFVKNLGGFQNLNQLMGSIKEGITEEKKLKEKQRVRLEIINHIIKNSSAAIPEFLANQQLDSMMSNLDKDLHTKGMELGLYLAQMGKTQDDLRKEWRNEAEKQVKIVMVLHKIAKDNKISASREEVDEALSAAVQSVIMKGEADKANLDMESLRDNISSHIINEKVFDFLEKTCSV